MTARQPTNLYSAVSKSSCAGGASSGSPSSTGRDQSWSSYTPRGRSLTLVLLAICDVLSLVVALALRATIALTIIVSITVLHVPIPIAVALAIVWAARAVSITTITSVAVATVVVPVSVVIVAATRRCGRAPATWRTLATSAAVTVAPVTSIKAPAGRWRRTCPL